jgi:2-methylcitrate dehydratase
VAFKRFPIQIELQAVAEAGASLSAKVRDRAQNIRTITVETYPGIIERVFGGRRSLESIHPS